MPIFGGTKRPRMDGLSKDEEKRRDALTPEVLSRAGAESGTIGQEAAAASLLKELVEREPRVYLWQLLLGRQLMGMRRFGPAIAAFESAVSLDVNDIRGYYGAGHAYFQAAETRQTRGEATSEDAAPPNMTADNLYQEALRHFRRAQELAEKNERDELGAAVATVERAVARKAGRL